MDSIKIGGMEQIGSGDLIGFVPERRGKSLVDVHKGVTINNLTINNFS